MNKSSPGLPSPPEFTTNGNGEAMTVTLDTAAYVALLVKANVTDAGLWPPGMQEGAAALARLRAIEKRCVAKHGKFDWAKLSPRLQNEYDALCARLDKLQDTGERIPLGDYQARRAESGR
jgi:hypothetical protein